MLSKNLIICAAALALAAPAALGKGKPKPLKQHVHDHGHAKLSIAIDNDLIGFDLEIPGDDVFGFEHPPKTDAEKKTVDDAMATLNGKALELFVLPADLGCAAQAAKATRNQEGSHADVDATYKIKCAEPLAGAELKLGLFKVFSRLKEVKVQVNSGAKQSAQSAKSADDAVKL